MEIREDEVQQEVDVTDHPKARLDFGQPDDLGFEALDRIKVLSFQSYLYEDIQAGTDTVGVNQRHIPVDESIHFQSPDPAEARRRREANPVRQLLVGDPPLLLEYPEDVPVDRVEGATATHDRSLAAT